MTKTVQVGPYALYADDGDGADPTGLKVLQHGIGYERHIRTLLERHIPSSRGFIDIGANVGIHSISAKSIRPDVPVVAVEASAFNVALLEKTVRENRIEGLAVLHYALSDAVGTKTIHGHKLNRWIKHVDRETTEGEPVLVYPLDMIISQPFDLVKLDVEGSELHVLRGAGGLMSQKPKIIFEYSIPALEGAGVNPRDLLDFLLERGYTLYSLPSHQWLEERRFTESKELHEYIARSTVIADIFAVFGHQ